MKRRHNLGNITDDKLQELEKYETAFYTYQTALTKRIAEMTEKFCSIEDPCGCLCWFVSGTAQFGTVKKKFDCFYATPFWEGAESIPVQFMVNDGDYVDGVDIPFPIKDLTMNVEKDAQRYIAAVRSFLDDRCTNICVDFDDVCHL